jgi:hypothetical protein
MPSAELCRVDQYFHLRCGRIDAVIRHNQSNFRRANRASAVISQPFEQRRIILGPPWTPSCAVISADWGKGADMRVSRNRRDRLRANMEQGACTQAKLDARRGRLLTGERIKTSVPHFDDPFSNVLTAGVAPIGSSRNRRCRLNRSAENRGSRRSCICTSRKRSAKLENREGSSPWFFPRSRGEATRRP